MDDLQFPRGIRQDWGGKWEREEKGYSSVWERHRHCVCVCVARMWMSMTQGLRNEDVSHNDYKCAHSLLFHLFHLLIEHCLYVDLFTSLMPPQPVHLWTSQHRCVCGAIDALQPDLSNMLTLTWHECMFEWLYSVYYNAHFGGESCCLVAKSSISSPWALGLHLTFKHKHLRAAEFILCSPLSHVIRLL